MNLNKYNAKQFPPEVLEQLQEIPKERKKSKRYRERGSKNFERIQETIDEIKKKGRSNKSAR